MTTPLSSACSPESEEPTSALSERDSAVSPKLKSTGTDVPYSSATGPTFPDLTMCEKLAPTTSPEQMSLLEVSPARTSARRESVVAWLESGVDSSMNSAESLMSALPTGFASRTSLVFCPPREARTSRSSSASLPGSGRRSPTDGAQQGSVAARSETLPGVCLTLAFSESPNVAAEYILSEVQESQVDSKYFLSPKAARGILRRAGRRGRRLPPRLHEALMTAATSTGNLSQVPYQRPAPEPDSLPEKARTNFSSLDPCSEAERGQADLPGSHKNQKCSFVRRLTPTECERLQAFPDGWTCLCGRNHGRSAPAPTAHDTQASETP